MANNGGIGAKTARILAAHDGDRRLTASEIARRTGATRNAVIGALRRHRPNWAEGHQHGPTPKEPVSAQMPRSGLTCTYLFDARSAARPWGEGVRDPDARWCGKPVLPGKAWCADCSRRVFRKEAPEEVAA